MMTSQDVSARLKRVAAILAMLDEPTRQELLQRFDPELVQRLTTAMAASEEKPVSFRQRQQALAEFEQLMRIAKRYHRPPLKIHRGEEAEEASEVAPYQLTGNALKDLEHIPIHQVAAAFEYEHPRTASLLMKSLSPQRNAELLALLPEAARDAVVCQMSLDPTATAPVLQQMAKGAVERALTFPAKPIQQTTSLERLTQVLRATDKSGRRKILEAISGQDPELASNVKRQLYRFEDIAKLGDREIQQVLGKVDGGTLAMAMFECDPVSKERIFANLSRRARATLQEELEFQRHLPASQVQAARVAVSDAISEVDEESE